MQKLQEIGNIAQEMILLHDKKFTTKSSRASAAKSCLHHPNNALIASPLVCVIFNLSDIE